MTTEESASVNNLPCIVKLSRRVKKLSAAPVGSQRDEKYHKVNRRLKSERQRQRRLLLVEIVNRFKKEQPVIDSEQQLSGKVVNEDTRNALEQSNMTPEQLRSQGIPCAQAVRWHQQMSGTRKETDKDFLLDY